MDCSALRCSCWVLRQSRSDAWSKTRSNLSYTDREQAIAPPIVMSKSRQSPWGWMWLGYTGFLLIQPLTEPSLKLWLGTLASLAIFLVIFWGFFFAADKSKSPPCWLIGATFTLGIVCFPWNQGASTFLIYAAAFLPFTLEPPRLVVALIFLVCTTRRATGAC